LTASANHCGYNTFMAEPLASNGAMKSAVGRKTIQSQSTPS
jgi:hypothetical protein